MNKRSSLMWVGSLVAAGIVFASHPACAEMMHLKVDTQKSEISAVVKDPLSSLRDIPSYAEGTFDIITGEKAPSTLSRVRSTPTRTISRVPGMSSS
jgi:hypothetical protein